MRARVVDDSVCDRAGEHGFHVGRDAVVLEDLRGTVEEGLGLGLLVCPQGSVERQVPRADEHVQHPDDPAHVVRHLAG
jgi:hypothetical protein